MTMSIAEVRETLTAPGQMFEITEDDIRGVPIKVWKHTPANLRDVLNLSRLHGDKTFLVYENERATFEEHFRQAAAFARCLVERYGVTKGDRVAIAMRNFPEWVVAFWGDRGRGDRGAAQRLVDGPRAGVRPVRLRIQGARRRFRAHRAPP